MTKHHPFVLVMQSLLLFVPEGINAWIGNVSPPSRLSRTEGSLKAVASDSRGAADDGVEVSRRSFLTRQASVIAVTSIFSPLCGSPLASYASSGVDLIDVYFGCGKSTCSVVF